MRSHPVRPRNGSGGVSPEQLADTVDEVKQTHLEPVKMSATVVERASDDVCDLVEDQTERTAGITEEIASLSATGSSKAGIRLWMGGPDSASLSSSRSSTPTTGRFA